VPGSLRRGFKSEAEEISLEIRDELGVGVAQRLDAQALADHLAIPVAPVTALERHGASRQAIASLIAADSGFSAFTVCFGSRMRIFYNPRHPAGRHANSLAHELSHVLLEHEPHPALGDDGRRIWDAKEEAEADWLAGALLVPREGALVVLSRGIDTITAAAHFGVSVQLFSWRANQTGVIRQLEYRKRRARVH
jgi:Zn-dependent peptidase ImmA (M78 family)